jgi:hypothetical protein
MKRSLAIALFGTALILGLAPVNVAVNQYELGAESRIWIEGRSNVDRFTCRAGEMRGIGQVPENDTAVRVTVGIPVEKFDCGRRKMNEDFYAALASSRHPEIRFTLTRVIPLGASGGEQHLQVSGLVSLAGTERPVTFRTSGKEQADGRLVGSGSVPLRMTDFGIEPPTALLGLVRAHDDITVHFDLTAVSR